jgi:uncharacterized membrane protein
MHHRRRRLEHAARACDIIHIPSGENIAKMATFVSALMGAPVAFAQVATTLEQAELAGLSPAKRAEVQARAVNGNTVDEVLQTVRLNSIKVRHPASRIVALDFLRGIAAVKTAGGRIELNAIRYDHAGHNGLTSGPGDRTGGDLPMPRSAAPILRIVPGRAGSRRHVRLNRLFQPVKAGAVWPVLGHAGRSFFMMPLAGAAIDAASGEISGKLTDVGLNDQFMKDVGKTLQSGNTALFLLIRKMTTDKVAAALQGTGGTLLRSSFDGTKEEVLQAALAGAQEAVSRASANP